MIASQPARVDATAAVQFQGLDVDPALLRVAEDLARAIELRRAGDGRGAELLERDVRRRRIAPGKMARLWWAAVQARADDLVVAVEREIAARSRVEEVSS